MKKVLHTEMPKLLSAHPSQGKMMQLSLCHSSILCVFVLALSRVQLFVTPWSAACHAPLSMEFSRQEYWSGLHFLLQGIFSTQGEDVAYVSCIDRWILYPHHLGSPNLSSTHPITFLLHLYIAASIHLCSLPPNNLHIFIGLFQVDPYYTFK